MNKNDPKMKQQEKLAGEEKKTEKRLRPLPPEYATLLIASCASSMSPR